MAQTDPADRDCKTLDHRPGAVNYLEDHMPVVNVGGGFACLLLLCLTALACFWIWTEHRSELVEAQTKAIQLEARVNDARLNAQELRALYRIKMRGKQ